MPAKKTKIPGRNSKRDYPAIAAKYAADVLSGEIPACKWVRLACQRQVNDLKRKGFPYRFDLEKAGRVCQFIELLPHVKGTWKTATLKLESWQIFVLCCVFGWVDKAGNRRYRTTYVEVPRKNGKSSLSSGIALFLVAADGESGAEVYSAATTRDQARIVFDDAQKMVRATTGLASRFGVAVTAHAITVIQSGSSFKALSAEGSTLDGLNVHAAIIDELHAHKTREVFDVINSATGSRNQPLIWTITTAGFNRSGVCYEQRGYLCKVLEHIHEDESYFGLIYSIDDGDDWTAESSWRKANPNYGVSVLEKDIAILCRQAMQSAQSQNNFLTKRLNVWVNADVSWMNMAAWDAQADPTLTEAQFERGRCYIGLDLATKVDIAASIKLFLRDGKYYVFGRYYLPESAVESGVNTNAAHYAGWANEDRLTLTPGEVTDFDIVRDDLLADLKAFDVREIAFDPYQALPLTNSLQKDGVRIDKLIEVPATVANFSAAMKELEALVLSKRLFHNGDPVLAWMVSNVVCHTDAKDNIYPRKERVENKIDGVVALIMALGRALAKEGSGISTYATRGLLRI